MQAGRYWKKLGADIGPRWGQGWGWVEAGPPPPGVGLYLRLCSIPVRFRQDLRL